MKQINNYILERLHITKDTKVDNDNIHYTDWANIYNLLCMFGVNSHDMNIIKDSTNDKGDLYWTSVIKNSSTSHSFYNLILGKYHDIKFTNYIDIKNHIEENLDINISNIRITRIDKSVFTKDVFFIFIEIEDWNEILYIISGDEKIIKLVKYIFDKDNLNIFSDYDNNICNLYKK